MFEAANHYSSAAILFCSAQIIGPAGQPRFSFPDSVKRFLVPSGQNASRLKGERGLRAIMRGDFIVCPTMCYRRSKVKAPVFDSRWRQVLDLDLIARILLTGETPKRIRRILWEQSSLRGVLRRLQPDLVHFPYSSLPIGYRKRAVVTIHDTLRFTFPGQIPRSERMLKWATESWIRNGGHHVIAVSRDEQHEICRHIGIRPSNTDVVYHGVGEEFLNKLNPILDVPDRDAIVWIGRPYERKNVARLIEAFATLMRTVSKTRTKLRLVGIQGADLIHYSGLAERLGIGARVELLPPVPHTDIPDVLRRAILFAYPSTYESFGIPVLEAMACGIPVVCADIPVFRELCGDAVYYADPKCAESFAAVIAHALSSGGREQFRSMGAAERAAQFTWTKCAEETRHVYLKCLVGCDTSSAFGSQPG